MTDYFKNNESVTKIKEKYDTQGNSFSLTLFSKEKILKAIKSLSSNKGSPVEDILIKILKNSINIYPDNNQSQLISRHIEKSRWYSDFLKRE